MTRIESIFTMNQGRAEYPNVQRFRDAIAGLPDGKYINQIEKLFGVRSNPQNSYYWGVVLPAVQEGLNNVGYECGSVDEAHDICKHLFLKPKKRRKRLISKETGEIKYIQFQSSTKRLSTVEFNQYFEKIIRWSAEYLNIVIPYPNEEQL